MPALHKHKRYRLGQYSPPAGAACGSSWCLPPCSPPAAMAPTSAATCRARPTALKMCGRSTAFPMSLHRTGEVSVSASAMRLPSKIFAATCARLHRGRLPRELGDLRFQSGDRRLRGDLHGCAPNRVAIPPLGYLQGCCRSAPARAPGGRRRAVRRRGACDDGRPTWRVSPPCASDMQRAPATWKQ